MILEVKNLTTRFKSKKGVTTAVNNVSFQVQEGEILAIVGESGSGKSVTSLSIMGLTPGEVSGEIFFKGQDLAKKTSKEMQKIRGDQISMIFQEPMTSLNPVHRIKDQLMETILAHMTISKGDALKRAITMLDLVGIPSPEKRINDYPHQMSGGMRQRVMIAMALSCHPELLIADEPTTALDVTIQAQIMELITKLRQHFNMAVMLITHDLGVVAETADRVIVMYCGKIVEEAPVVPLFEEPKHPYTRGLLESIPRIDEDQDRLFMIKGMVPNPLNMPKGCAFSDRCDKCMDICRQKMPALVTEDGRAVRCFLYHNEAEDEL